MATTERNEPLIGGLTFLAATVVQIGVALSSRLVSGEGVIKRLEAHWYVAVPVLLLVSALLTAATLCLRSRRGAEMPEAELLDVAARDLVTSSRFQLEEESQLRLLDSPRPISIRWRNADDSLIDHWRNIRLDPKSDVAIRLDGELDDIVEVFRRVPSRRLVVLGRAGAGKSVLMMRFMKSMLGEHDGEGIEQIPVMLALSTWDPRSSPFSVWLARELATQHPSLGQRMDSGKSLAGGLIERGGLLYVLDGLDEMPNGLRSEALAAISVSLRRTDSLVLTCRLAEYRVAVAAGGVLAGAAAVVIKDLQPSDVQSYLPSTTGDARRGSRWTDVLADIENAAPGTPAIALREALRTPLMVQLARTAYQDPQSQPQELLNLSDTKSIENVLLDQYVAAALDPGPGMRARQQRSFHQTERYLSRIASYMVEADTPYFRWWDLHKSLNTRARISLGVFVGLATMLLFIALLISTIWYYQFGPGQPKSDNGAVTYDFLWTDAALLALPILAYCIFIGYLVGRHIQSGVPSNSVSPVVPVRLRRTWRRGGGARLRHGSGKQTFVTALRLGVIAGVLNGLATATVQVVADRLYGVGPQPWEEYSMWDEVGIGLSSGVESAIGITVIFTLALWAAFQVGQLIEEPVILTEVWSPLALLRSDRWTALLEAFMSLVAVGALLAVIVLPGTLNIFILDAFNVVPGLLLVTLIMIFLLTAWGRFALTRLYFGWTGKFPIRLFRFLSTMRSKGIMRQTGPAFQFRHLRLRDRLAIHQADARR